MVEYTPIAPNSAEPEVAVNTALKAFSDAIDAVGSDGLPPYDPVKGFIGLGGVEVPLYPVHARSFGSGGTVFIEAQGDANMLPLANFQVNVARVASDKTLTSVVANERILGFFGRVYDGSAYSGNVLAFIGSLEDEFSGTSKPTVYDFAVTDYNQTARRVTVRFRGNGTLHLMPRNGVPVKGVGAGQLFFDDAEKQFKGYDGTKWVGFGGSASFPEGGTAGQALVRTADGGVEWATISGGGGGNVGGGAAKPKIVLVRRTTPYAWPIANDWNLVPYDQLAKEELTGVWSASDPSRFNIPAGVKRVRFTAYFLFANATDRYIHLLDKNNQNVGASRPGVPTQSLWYNGPSAAGNQLVTRWMDVAQGDWFTFKIFSVSGNFYAGTDNGYPYVQVELDSGSVSGDASVIPALGSAAAPNMPVAEDADTGIFAPAANKLGLSTAGVQRMLVDETGKFSFGPNAPRSGFDTGLLTGVGAVSDYNKVQSCLTGGGTISWNIGGNRRLKWTNRILCLPAPYTITSGGQIQVSQPTVNIPAAQVYNNTARTADANGVVLNNFEALWLAHTPGGDVNAVTLFITTWNVNNTVPSNWILIACTNGEDLGCRLGNGLYIASGDTVIGGSVQSYLPRLPADNTINVGGASNRFATVFAATGTINTSDAREKTEVIDFEQAELEAAIEMSKAIGVFKYLAAIELKGDAARKHVGFTVQKAIEILERHGLDAMSYAFICHDVWEETPAVYGENLEGEPILIEEAKPAGDRYGFRYDQLNAFIAKGIAERLRLLEERA